MKETAQAIPQAVENSPWLSFGIILCVCFGSAFNVTFAEWRDAIDSSDTTMWQPELVMDSWVDGVRTFALAIYAYLTRSGAKAKYKDEG